MVDHGEAHAGSDVEVDIAVVGAGPAGAVAACVAARRGLSVALIDRNTFPRDKTCGDGIGPGAVRVLRELGIDSILAERSRIETVTLFGTEGERSETPVPDIRGTSTDVYIVPRLEFDEHVFRAAIASGAEDLTGTRYLGMSGVDDRARTIELRDAAGERRTLRARLVIGADGVYSTVRKDLTGNDRANPEFSGIAMRAYVECPDFEADAGHSLLFEFDRELLPSYGWVFPVGDGTVNLGVGIASAQLRERGMDLRKLLANFADRLRERGIAIGEIKDERAHQLRALMEMPQLAHDRAVLIGDAASMINPVSGEGIAYAMTAAQRLIDILPRDLADGPALAAALREFERGFRADHRLHLLSLRLTMAMLRRSASAAVVVRALQSDPRVLGGIFSMLFGDGRLNATTALRIARHAVR
jgi:geranylgeranyl reductase family protein